MNYLAIVQKVKRGRIYFFRYYNKKEIEGHVVETFSTFLAQFGKFHNKKAVRARKGITGPLDKDNKITDIVFETKSGEMLLHVLPVRNAIGRSKKYILDGIETTREALEEKFPKSKLGFTKGQPECLTLKPENILEIK